MAAWQADLVSDRLVLETLRPEHGGALFDALQDEAIFRWISGVPPVSVEALVARYARHLARRSEQHPVAWLGWAARRRSDGVYVGQLDADVEGSVVTNLGYVFFPPFWGAGFASEAVSTLVGHLVACGAQELRATVTVGNHASRRVLEKAGFVYVCTLPDHDTIRGELHDDWSYALVPG